MIKIQDSEIEALVKAFAKNQELLESDTKISQSIMREILADFNFFLMIVLKVFIDNGVFSEEEEENNTMFS